MRVLAITTALAVFAAAGCGREPASKDDAIESEWAHFVCNPGWEPWALDLCHALQADAAAGLNERKPDLSASVFIAGGTLISGPKTGGSSRESLPPGRRKVTAFFIDRFEATNRDYGECVAARQCLPLSPSPHLGTDYREPEYPAILDFRQARRYCRWRGKRLPTEYEWEFAARGRKNYRYVTGDNPPEPGWANVCGDACSFDWKREDWEDGYAYTAPAGAFPRDATAQGVMDMTGNLKEWTTTGEPLAPGQIIARGGSWYSDRTDLVPADARQIWQLPIRHDDKGVRCAADAGLWGRIQSALTFD
ncbi:formylglycine-generating enzyme family protein [bacterium]|nr:formylglycine-generating enzyme family protein [bacterium]